MPHKLFPSFLRPSLLFNITKLKKELTVRSLNQNVHGIHSHAVENPPVDELAFKSLREYSFEVWGDACSIFLPKINFSICKSYKLSENNLSYFVPYFTLCLLVDTVAMVDTMDPTQLSVNRCSANLMGYLKFRKACKKTSKKFWNF